MLAGLTVAGLSGCAEWSGSLTDGIEALPIQSAPSFGVSADGILGLPSRSAAVGPPDERTEPAEAPAPEPVGAEPAAEPENGEKPSEPESPTPAPLMLSQAEGGGFQKDLPAKPKGEEEEPYDPFATAEGLAEPIEEYDPWEPFNQAMFTFNRKLDEYLVRPVAKVYDKIMPDGLEEGLHNTFHTIRFVPRFVNNVLQGKIKGAAIEVTRTVLNASFGIAGMFDFAGEVLDLRTPVEDSGQTFGYYGIPPGPYLVIPIFGSFTVRDGLGYIGDLALDPFNWFVFPVIKLDGAPKLVTKEDTILFAQIGVRAGYIVNERSLNIETTFEGVEEATVDLYGAVRNAYLQKRAKAIRE
jgi:phospholipid-binding lipoprotein MlaA